MTTKQLRNKILDLAIHGRLVPQDENDEPASALLARIRAEKEQLVKDGKLKKKDLVTTPVSDEDKPFEVPEGWEWVTLRNIASFGGGKTPSMNNRSYWDNGNNLWVTSKDMKSKTIADSLMKITDSALGEMTQYEPGTLLMVTRSGILRRALPLSILATRGTINQDLKAISIVPPIDNEFIYISIMGREQLILKDYHKDGTTVDSINFEKFIDLPIPLPPLAEQERIVAAVEQWMSLVDIIESGKENLQQSIALAKNKILDLAIKGKLVEKEGVWEEKTLGEVCMLLSGRDLLGSECNDREEGIPYLIGASNINNGAFEINRWTNHPAVITQIDDILISCKGTVGEVVVNNLGEMHIARQFMALRVNNSSELDCMYLKYYLLATLTKIKESARGVIPGISRKDILELLIPLPPLAEQKRIVAKVEELFAQLDIIANALK